MTKIIAINFDNALVDTTKFVFHQSCEIFNSFERTQYPFPIKDLLFKTNADNILAQISCNYEVHVLVTKQTIWSNIDIESFINRSVSNVHSIHFFEAFGSVDKMKADYCINVGASMLIDVSPTSALVCASKGIPVLLIDQPSVVDNPLIRRVSNWESVLNQVEQHFSSSSSISQFPVPFNTETITPPLDDEDSITVAAVQLCSKTDKMFNLRVIIDLVTEAVYQGAELICLPENCIFMGASNINGAATDDSKLDFLTQNAEPPNGPSTQVLCMVARAYNVWLSVGGIREERPDLPEGGKSNTHLLISPAGEVTSRYYKIHLFDCPLVNLSESTYTVAGTEPVVADIVLRNGKTVRLGLTVCYDLRFAELYSKLREMGAQILLVPAAFTLATGRAGHWEVLLRARAIEQQCFVIAAAQAGRHNETRVSYGQSLIIDSWGTIVAACPIAPADVEAEGRSWAGASVCVARLSLSSQEQLRLKMPVQNHRRPDLFASRL